MNIEPERMADHFTKWHLRDVPFKAVLHHFTAPDFGDPHDHPWGFTSTILHGGYVEEVYDVHGFIGPVHRKVGETFRIPASHIHRIVDLPAGECWTLIIPGPHERTSGFYRWEGGRMLHRLWHEADFKALNPQGSFRKRN